MATYVIGDIHGHYRTLSALLDVIEYTKKRDVIYLTGDLVNGGKRSLEVLRWAKHHARIVLGNHDLHMLAVWYGHKFVRKKDTFDDVFEADDVDVLMKWLCSQPLLRVEEKFAVCHAGIYPKWSLKKASRIARETEQLYQGNNAEKWFRIMYGDDPTSWKHANSEVEKFRFAINAFTRMRVVDGKNLDLSFSGALNELPEGLTPWFDARREGWEKRVFFGHWAALGLRVNQSVAGIDSGVRWGGPLTAFRVDDQSLFQHPRVKNGK